MRYDGGLKWVGTHGIEDDDLSDLVRSIEDDPNEPNQRRDEPRLGDDSCDGEEVMALFARDDDATHAPQSPGE